MLHVPKSVWESSDLAGNSSRLVALSHANMAPAPGVNFKREHPPPIMSRMLMKRASFSEQIVKEAAARKDGRKSHHRGNSPVPGRAGRGDPPRHPKTDPVEEPLRPSKPAVVPTPNKDDRIRMFGIDCAELVHFNHWEPGGEYIKNLIVKNVVMKTQKLRYKLPVTRFFSMEFPETITLSAGMSWTVPITFRPVAKESYSDVIEFATSFGKFNLRILASLPKHSLTFIPPVLDFNFRPVKESAQLALILRNSGELPSTFDWAVDKPFRFTPSCGKLEPLEETTVIVDFQPEDASVFQARAVCHFGDPNNWTSSRVQQGLDITGIGKFSHLVVHTGDEKAEIHPRFDFGDVYVGRVAERTFKLVNFSTVEANFRIVPAEERGDPYFHFSAYSGTVSANSSKEFKVKVTTPISHSIRFLTVRSRQGCIHVSTSTSPPCLETPSWLLAMGWALGQL